MMTAYIILGVVLSLPLVLGLIFRVSSSHLFFSLLAGELLSRTFGDDLQVGLSVFVHRHTITDYTRLAVIVLPILLTAIFLRRTLTKGKMFLQLVPLAATGVVFAAFILPIVPVAVQDQIKSIKIGRQLLSSSSMIVGVVVLLQLITLWLLSRSREHSKKHH